MSGIVSFSLQRISAQAPISDLVQRIGRLALLVFRVDRERRQLAELEDWQLADLGLSREAAEAEAARNLGDLPVHRKAGLYL